MPGGHGQNRVDEGFVRIDSAEFHALFLATRQADKKLYTRLRKQLRESGQEVTADIKSEIGKAPSSGKYRGGIRAGLAAGTRTSILASSAKTAGVRITTSPSKLPPGKRALAKSFNLPFWRHPVFADTKNGMRNSRTSGFKALAAFRRKSGGAPLKSWTWVEQMGRPYFGVTVMRHSQQMKVAVIRVVEDVAAELPNFTP